VVGANHEEKAVVLEKADDASVKIGKEKQQPAVTSMMGETTTSTMGEFRSSAQLVPRTSEQQTTQIDEDENENENNGQDAASFAPTRLTATHQTSKELDSDVAAYIAAMTAKLKM
jgi:hypothetical protein